VIDQIRTQDGEFAAGGIRFSVFSSITLYARAATLDCSEIIGNGVMWTRMTVAEDLTLYAFSSEERREVFDRLVKISGVGPGTALLVLELGQTTDILRAVASADSEFFRQVPGVGATRIEKIFARLGQGWALPPATTIPILTWIELRDAAGYDIEQFLLGVDFAGQPENFVELTLSSWKDAKRQDI